MDLESQRVPHSVGQRLQPGPSYGKHTPGNGPHELFGGQHVPSEQRTAHGCDVGVRVGVLLGVFDVEVGVGVAVAEGLPVGVTRGVGAGSAGHPFSALFTA